MTSANFMPRKHDRAILMHARPLSVLVGPQERVAVAQAPRSGGRPLFALRVSGVTMARVTHLATLGMYAAAAFAGGCNKQPDRGSSATEGSSSTTQASEEDPVPELSSAEVELASELRRALDTV